jgi:hypothetical protein
VPCAVLINLVETKFCSDLPGVAEMLHSSKSIEIQDGHHSDNNSNGKSVGIHDRIKAFCKSQEEFNKKHPVSRSVKTFVDVSTKLMKFLICVSENKHTV